MMSFLASRSEQQRAEQSAPVSVYPGRDRHDQEKKSGFMKPLSRRPPGPIVHGVARLAKLVLRKRKMARKSDQSARQQAAINLSYHLTHGQCLNQCAEPQSYPWQVGLVINQNWSPAPLPRQGAAPAARRQMLASRTLPVNRHTSLRALSS